MQHKLEMLNIMLKN